MNVRELVSAYNCVLAAIYNYLADVYKFKFPVESMYITPRILELSRKDGILSITLPEYVIKNFLDSIEAEIRFPDMKSVNEAIAFADEHLQKKGVVPVNINLRYDILEPLSFDNDYWHFHLIVERASSHQFRMFDQFENEYYLVEEEHLKKAMDTEFNYRFSPGFTPFMLIHVPAERVELTAQKLKSRQIGWHEISSVIEHYPLQHNIEQGLMLTSYFARFHKEKPSAETKYHVLNYSLIIAKSREAYIRCMEKTFGTSMRHNQMAEDLYSVYQYWMEFRNTLGMALTRCGIESFDGLDEKYKALIEYEYDTFSRVLNWIKGEGLNLHIIDGNS